VLRDGLFVVMQEKKLKGQEKLQTLRKPRPVEVRRPRSFDPDALWTRSSGLTCERRHDGVDDGRAVVAMSFAEGSSQYAQSPRLSQFQHYDASTPPPPPPKPPGGRDTPSRGPPLPPPPTAQPSLNSSDAFASQPQNQIPLPAPGWLPSIVHDLSTDDLRRLLENPDLQAALLNDYENTHPSIPASQDSLRQILDSNLQMASSLQQVESRLQHQRAQTQSRLISLRALEQQHKSKIVETEDTLKGFSPMALYQRLSASAQEQDALVKGIQDSFLDDGGLAPDRDVQDFVRRLREAKRVAFLRNQRKERWDEGRVGGWR
jgi:hypothetical protein